MRALGMGMRNLLGLPATYTPNKGGGAIIFSDDFNRADENLGVSPNWTRINGVAGAATISNNKVACNTTDTTGTAYLTPLDNTPNHYIEADNLSSGIGGPFLAARISDIFNWVGVRYNSAGPAFELYQRVSGTLTLLGSYNDTPLSRMRLEVSGSTVTVKINGVTRITASYFENTTVTRAGIVARVIAKPEWLDNIEMGPL